MATKPKPTFASRLRHLREQAQLTATALAQSAGVSASTLSELEHGQYDPSWGTAVKLAEALGCTLEDFR